MKRDNTVLVKTPGIRFKGPVAVPWWKMELILDIIHMDDKPKGVLNYRIVPVLPPVAQHKCEAEIWHGPGHQTRSKCEVLGVHNQHSYSFQQLYWSTKSAYSGHFDQSPEDQGEPRYPKIALKFTSKPRSK